MASDRAVFLDIDGVLAPWGRCAPALDAECISRVRVLHGVARIVLSSSWGVTDAEEYGIPVDDSLDDDERKAPARERLDGIFRYLREHPEIKSWVSIDDDLQERAIDRMNDMADSEKNAVRPRLMRTDWAMYFGDTEGAGLTEEVLHRALEVLDGPV